MKNPPATPPAPKPRRGGPTPKFGAETPIARTFSILPSDLEHLLTLGHGNRSAGLRAALDFYRQRNRTGPHPLMHCDQCGQLKGHGHTCTP